MQLSYGSTRLHRKSYGGKRKVERAQSSVSADQCVSAHRNDGRFVQHREVRFLNRSAVPARPLNSSNIVAGSGTASTVTSETCGPKT